MAGQGDGLLQPTKLVQNDDFMPSLALPGYYTHNTELDLSNGGANLAATILAVVPDGITADLIDVGFTASETGVAGGTSALVEVGFSGLRTDDDDFYVAGASITDTLAAGNTDSVLRSSSASWVFAETASVSNAIDIPAGTAITVKATKQGSGGGTCKGFLWIRLKYKSKDVGAI